MPHKRRSSEFYISDSPAECEEEVMPGAVQMEEKAFISSLHSFMKNKGTPIERIPHLGFKQINLWRIYRAVDKLGGYDSVTARRLWKKVYDELGGSPGSTSAATCTRRHYEKLVLPFERHLKGEEDRPLPPSKPRKPYKRNLEGKVYKADGKRKKTHPDSEVSRRQKSFISIGVCLYYFGNSSYFVASSQPSRAGADLYTHILQAPTSASWITHVPPAAGEVISPLEKKKRMAQASLHLPRGSQSEDKDRPSVIHCSQSPARAPSGRNRSFSDGSPLPLSSSSSRSPSPLSVSSEDGAAGSDYKPAASSELTQNCRSTVKNTPDCSEEGKSVTSQTSKPPPGQNNNTAPVRAQPLSPNSVKQLNQDSAWKPYYKANSKYFSYPLHSLSSLSSTASPSSFTKVASKSVQLLRPAPIRPGYKMYPSRLQVESQTCTKRMHNMTPWPYQTEKREKCRTAPQKAPPVQQSAIHSAAALPSYDKPGRDSRYQPVLHPAYVSNRVRLPQSQLMYRHLPISPAVIGSAVYPYPYAIPLYNSQSGYAIPAINPVYPHKL
uniref:AT rich interactive domain 5A (MRF1-like) n=1 Tax=Salarias fasciatus TaxID=181472 RepID=A0A672H3F5_SALFA